MSKKKARSLQDILRDRQQEEFVGREEHLAFFQANMGYDVNDPRRHFIINISGQGGVGKTWLLRRFQKIAEEAGAITAYTDEAEEDVPSVMGRIAEQFEAQGHSLETFAERYKVYRQKRQEIEADPEAPQGLPALLGHALAKGGLDAIRGLGPVGSVVAGAIDEKALIDLSCEVASYVARKIKNKDEVRLVLEPVEVLAPLFLADLRTMADKHFLTLLFDTYEHTGSFLDPWLRDLLEGRHGDVPMNIALVATGRDTLDRNLWAPYEGLLARLSLNPFTEEEVRDYLARKGITGEQVVEVILHLSGRLPLLVATLAAESPNDPAKVGDPSGEAVERFLKWVEDPNQRQVALNAALPRRLNRDVLAVLAEEEGTDMLFAWLRRMPFVEKRGDGWAYHEVVRIQMLRYKRQEAPRGWAYLHRRLAEYYDGLDCSPGLEQQTGQQVLENQPLDSLYHRLCQGSPRQLADAINDFVTVYECQPEFAFRIANTVLQAGTDAGISEAQAWGKRLIAGTEAYEEARYEVAAELFTALLHYAGINQVSSAVAFAHRAEIYSKMKSYDKALDDISQAIQLSPGYARAIGTRAKIYRQTGDYERALADLTRSIELEPSLAWLVSSRGETLRLLRRYEEALLDFTRAIELAPGSSRVIAARGVVYLHMRLYADALVDFTTALELEPTLPWALSGKGEVLRRTGHYDDALAEFNRAIQALADFQMPFVGRGMTYLLMGCLADASSDFTYALEVDPDSDESLYGRALTHELAGDMERGRQDLCAAIQAAQRKHAERPSDWRRVQDLALYYLAMDQVEEARSLYRDTLSSRALVLAFISVPTMRP